MPNDLILKSPNVLAIPKRIGLDDTGLNVFEPFEILVGKGWGNRLILLTWTCLS